MAAAALRARHLPAGGGWGAPLPPRPQPVPAPQVQDGRAAARHLLPGPHQGGLLFLLHVVFNQNPFFKYVLDVSNNCIPFCTDYLPILRALYSPLAR